MHHSFDFYSKLKSQQSSSILGSIKKFINELFKNICDNSDDLNDISSQYQDFVSKLTYDFAAVWKIEFYEEKSIYSNIINGFENILCKLLYKRIMNEFVDSTFNYESLLFITLADLDIKDYDYSGNIDELSSQLNKFTQISQYQTPREKLIILCNLCNYINLSYANFDRIKITKFLVYMFIHSEIRDLKNQLLFCALFRHKTIINSDEDYYLSLAIQAIDFAMKINHKNVKMTQEEFQQKKSQKWENEILTTFSKSYNLDKIESIINIPVDNLYKEYCIKDKNEMTLEKFEKLRNDFKIILKLIESNNI